MTEAHLPITNVWRERLLAVRRDQAITPEVETLLGVEAVFLYGWLGNSAHLGMDGRVVAWAAAEGHPPAVVSDPVEIARLVTLGSRWLGLPELADLLPPGPIGSVACPYCGGQRWDATPHSGHPVSGVCIVCKGVGRRLPKTAEPAAAPDRC
jgi:hypothetical protein